MFIEYIICIFILIVVGATYLYCRSKHNIGDVANKYIGKCDPRSIMHGTTKVLDNLYISDWVNAVDEKKLKKNKIKYVVCLNEKVKSGEELAIYDKLGIAYDINAASDATKMTDHPTSMKKMKAYLNSDGFKTIDKFRQQGKAVLIHCTAGISRSATVVIAYLMKYEGMTMTDAILFLKRKRCIINPNTGFRAVLRHL
jgi:predicted protein tyrosine phosphatase